MPTTVLKTTWQTLHNSENVACRKFLQRQSASFSVFRSQVSQSDKRPVSHNTWPDKQFICSWIEINGFPWCSGKLSPLFGRQNQLLSWVLPNIQSLAPPQCSAFIFTHNVVFRFFHVESANECFSAWSHRPHSCSGCLARHHAATVATKFTTYTHRFIDNAFSSTRPPATSAASCHHQ